MPKPWLPSPPSIDTNIILHSNSQGINGVEMEDWNQAGNFVNKPVRGWLHPDQKIAESGISYGVHVCILEF